MWKTGRAKTLLYWLVLIVLLGVLVEFFIFILTLFFIQQDGVELKAHEKLVLLVHNWTLNNGKLFTKGAGYLGYLLTHYLNEIILLLTLGAMISYIPQKNTFHTTWSRIYPDLLKEFEEWVRYVDKMYRNQKELKWWDRKSNRKLRELHERQQALSRIVATGKSDEIKYLWEMLVYFSCKLDKTVKEIIRENEVYPVLFSEEDGENEVGELFDSLIVQFALKSSKMGGFRAGKALGNGFRPWKYWREYFSLPNDVSLYKYDILRRVYSECAAKTRV